MDLRICPATSAWGGLEISVHVADRDPEEVMCIVSLPADRLAGPEQPAVEETAAYVVTAAVWAPSVHNIQPWWFSADGQELSLHADAGPDSALSGSAPFAIVTNPFREDVRPLPGRLTRR
jgi:hypothetical protein